MIACLTLACVATSHAQPAPTETQAWNRFGAIFDVRQDASGLLWVGTAEGAFSFDGVRFDPLVPFDVGTSTPPAQEVLPASSGDVWVATGSPVIFSFLSSVPEPVLDWPRGARALVRMRAGQRRLFGVADGLPSERVLAITETRAGAIWVGTDRGLVRLDGERFVPVPVGGSDGRVVTAVAERGDDLLVGTMDGLWVGSRDGRNWRRYRQRLVVTSIRPGSGGTWWVGTHNGLWRTDQATGNLTHVALSRLITDVAPDAEGGAFVSLFDDVMRVDGRGNVTTVPDAPFSRRLLVDAEGSLWAATRASGVVQRRRARVATVHIDSERQVVFSVLPVLDGSVWMTSTLGVSRWRDGALTTFRYQRPVPAWQARSLAQTSDGAIWIHGYGEGLIRLRGETFDRIAASQLPRREPRTLITDPRGKLWVAWIDGAISRLDDAGPPLVWRTWSTTDGACAGNQTAGSARDGASVWFAGEGGLTQVVADQARCTTASNGLPITRLRAVHADGHGGVWLAPDADLGLVHFRQGRAKTVDVEGNWGAFLGIAEDRTGALWLSSTRGVARVSGAELTDALTGPHASVRPLVYDPNDGMQIAECTGSFAPSIAIDGHDRVWAPTLVGAVHIAPPQPISPRAQPLISGILVDGGQHPPTARVELPRSTSSIELRYAVPTFRAAHRVRLAHRLVGVDAGWVDASALRSARYVALPAGTLTFEVRARDEFDRPLGGLASLTLVVPAPWHRNPFVLATSLAALLLLARFVHRRRVQAIQAGHSLIDEERRRIARDLHDGMAQGFAAARIQIEVAKRSLVHAEPSVSEALDAAEEALGSTQGEVHRAIWSLRNHDPRGATVAHLLARLADESSGVGGASVTVQAADVAAVLVGDEEHEVESILREAIVNAIKHAAAERITLKAEQQAEVIVFEVADNGQGITASSPPMQEGGAGLLGMRERAARLRASLRVTSRPGQGTLVRLLLPHPLADKTGAA